MRIGFHISISGSIIKSIERAKRVHCQTMQIFIRNPRLWQRSGISRKEIEEFRKIRKKAEIYPLFVHVPYLINLASPDKEIWEKSVNFFSEDLKLSQLIGADYLVTHLGSHKGRGMRFGIKKITQGINLAIRKAEPNIKILLENTAGQGNSLGYDFSQIKEIIAGVKNNELIGLCLDTAHAFAAGYNIKDKNGLNNLIAEFFNLGLLKNLALIHLNDSKFALGTCIDRHEHIGKGKIGKEGFKLILNHPRLKDLTFIMETPGDSEKDDLMNLKVVRGLISEKCLLPLTK